MSEIIDNNLIMVRYIFDRVHIRMELHVHVLNVLKNYTCTRACRAKCHKLLDEKLE